MSKLIEIGHGGSRNGQGNFVPWGDQCLIKLDLLEEAKEFRPCAQSLANTEESPWFVLGTMFHHYMEEYFKFGNTDRLRFSDTLCGYVAEDIEDEAWRLFQAMGEYLESMCKKVWYIEQDIDGPYMRDTFGVDVTGRIDIVFEKEDGRLIIGDWKTAGRSAATKNFPNADYNKYVYKDGFFQRVVYTHGAIAAGLGDADRTIEGFEFWRITKTKTPEVAVHEAHWVSQKELEIVRNYLQFCEERRNTYDRVPLISQCRDCEFKFDGTCPVWPRRDNDG